MALEQLGAIIFKLPPGRLGIVSLVTGETDNEQIFEILLTLTDSGLTGIDKGFNDLSDTVLVHYINERFIYLGYKIAVETVPYANGSKMIHYCSINEDGYRLNKFHPYRLMEHMDKIPKSYEDYFEKPEYLHQVFGVVRAPEHIIVIRYNPVNIIMNN